MGLRIGKIKLKMTFKMCRYPGIKYSVESHKMRLTNINLSDSSVADPDPYNFAGFGSGPETESTLSDINICTFLAIHTKKSYSSL
jgi:hypothetical protein